MTLQRSRTSKKKKLQTQDSPAAHYIEQENKKKYEICKKSNKREKKDCVCSNQPSLSTWMVVPHVISLFKSYTPNNASLSISGIMHIIPRPTGNPSKPRAK
jgi:hypothetical protein